VRGGQDRDVWQTLISDAHRGRRRLARADRGAAAR
jgi:hypothetical protein